MCQDTLHVRYGKRSADRKQRTQLFWQTRDLNAKGYNLQITCTTMPKTILQSQKNA